MASYTLHIQYVDRPAETRTFTQPKVVLGRESGDIALHDTQVSGRHGEISFDGTTLRYTDVGSTNGSFLLQGQRVANIELTAGIGLRLGNSLITVQAIDVPNAAGKGRTVIAGPGMAPGFPAPMRPPGPPVPAAPIPRPNVPMPAPQAGGFAYAPTAQMQTPVPPGMNVGAVLNPPAPQAHVPAPQPQHAVPTPQPHYGGPAPQVPAPGPAPHAVAPPAPMAAPPAPMATPAPMSAAPMPGVPMPPGPPPGMYTEPTAEPAAEAMQPVAMAAQSAMSGGPGASAALHGVGPSHEVAPTSISVDSIKAAGLRAWDGIKDHIVHATLITAIVSVPMAVLSWLVTISLGVTGFGWVLLLLFMLVRIAATLVLAAALMRFVLGVAVGQPIDPKAAIEAQIADIKTVALNFLLFGVVTAIAVVFVVVPAFFVAAFLGPIYFGEGKRMGDAISRNVELVKRDPWPLIVNALVLGVIGGVVIAIPAMVFAYVPFLGGLVSGLITAVGFAALTPVILMLLVQAYFQFRQRFDGGDPVAEVRAHLAAPPAPSV